MPGIGYDIHRLLDAWIFGDKPKFGISPIHERELAFNAGLCGICLGGKMS